MYFTHYLSAVLLAAATLSSARRVVRPLIGAVQPTTFPNRTIFTPPSDYTDPGVLYARTAQLADGTLLAAWENYSPEPPIVHFPIYRSLDDGRTWAPFSNVTDTVNGLGLRYQPFLYVLPQAIGGFEAGTVLLAGNSVPTDLSSTHIDLYASTDGGATWRFVSHIASGGVAIPDNGLTPIWEPFLMLHQGKLICYYSDQRANTTHGQKLVHQTSTDLRTWGPVVDDVAHPTYTDRPGMTTVTQLPNGAFIMTYEYGSFFNTSTYSFPVFYRIAENPEAFNEAEDHKLIVTDGAAPTSSPYITWTSAGGVNGTLVVSSYSHATVFTNQALGEGEWIEVATQEPASYSRSLRILAGDPTKLLIIGAGQLPPSTTNKVTVSVMNI